MVATFSGGTAYVQSADVINYLKIQDFATQDDYNWLDGTVIPWVCEYIDSIAGTTWGMKLAQNEIYTIGRPAAYSMYLVGAPVYLQHQPIIPAVVSSSVIPVANSGIGFPMEVQNSVTPLNLKVWNGVYYEYWVQNGTPYAWENRNGMYWIDRETGILYIIGWFFYMGYEVSIDYYYGYNTAGTPQLDGQVYWLALLLSAKYFLDSERYTAKVSEGIGGIDMTSQWNYLNRRIKELEDYVRGFRHLAGGWIP